MWIALWTVPRGRIARDRPLEPFRPSTCAVSKPARNRVPKAGKEVDCWDVRFKIDGRRYFRRVTAPVATGAWVQKWVQAQSERFLLGWEFDPERREFVDPNRPTPVEPAEADGSIPTVFTEAAAWMWRQWPRWQPRTRQTAARSLRRACLTLLRPGPDGQVPDPPRGADRYLEWVFAPGPDAESVRRAVLLESRIPPDPLRTGVDQWLATNSMPFADVGWPDLERLLNAYATNQHAGGRRVAPATERRMVADLRQFRAYVVGRLDRPENPWERRPLRRRGPRGRVRDRGSGWRP